MLAYHADEGPTLFVQSLGERLSSSVTLSLTNARDKYLIRLTGGCGYMSLEDAEGLYDLFVDAFADEFHGAILFGGTQMRMKEDVTIVRPGITEVVPRIKKRSPNTITLGVVPRVEGMRLSKAGGLIVYDDPVDPYFTQVHPDQDLCVIVQNSVDTDTVWDTEYVFVERATQTLEQICHWKQLLIAYNGGGVTEKEILLWCKHGWPVLLINGSGRTSGERLANDAVFLAANKNVHVAEKNTASIRAKLQELGAIA